MVLQIARTVRPSAILLDILMPGLNGWDVLDTLKSDPVTASIPVVIVSILEEPQNTRAHGAIGNVDSAKMRKVLRLISGDASEAVKDRPEAREIYGG